MKRAKQRSRVSMWLKGYYRECRMFDIPIRQWQIDLIKKEIR